MKHRSHDYVNIFQVIEITSYRACLTFSQTPNFRSFQTERVGRRQFQIWRKWKKVIQTGRKHYGKRLVSQRRQKVSLYGNGLMKCICYIINENAFTSTFMAILSRYPAKKWTIQTNDQTACFVQCYLDKNVGTSSLIWSNKDYITILRAFVFIIFFPHKINLFEGILESACLSAHPSVCPYICLCTKY